MVGVEVRLGSTLCRAFVLDSELGPGLGLGIWVIDECQYESESNKFCVACDYL